jgi:hypothetical protein
MQAEKQRNMKKHPKAPKPALLVLGKSAVAKKGGRYFWGKQRIAYYRRLRWVSRRLKMLLH